MDEVIVLTVEQQKAIEAAILAHNTFQVESLAQEVANAATH